MNKVILTPHYTHYSMPAPLTPCLLSEVYCTLACPDHLSKQSTPSPSGAGSDSALGNGNWQRLASQSRSLTQSWIWAPVLITASFSTLFLLFFSQPLQLCVFCLRQVGSMVPYRSQYNVALDLFVFLTSLSQCTDHDGGYILLALSFVSSVFQTIYQRFSRMFWIYKKAFL